MMNLQNNYYSSQNGPHRRSGIKRLGAYLVEAGLVSPAQIQVALNDQEITGLRLGEIVAAHGWVKQQTIEFVMNRVVLPERQAVNTQDSQVGQSRTATAVSEKSPTSKQPFTSKREVPVTKPLPSVKSAEDDDVTWIG
jgi:mannitol/fructose-specific phosphotransferase system IIA component